MTNLGSTDEQAAVLRRPPIDWWLSHMDELDMDARGQALTELASYVHWLEATALKRPYTLSRLLEDIAFFAGVSILIMYAATEIMERIGFVKIPPEHSHIPVGLLLTCVLLVAPKAIGKAAASKVWGSVGDGVSKLIARGRPATPGEKDQ